MNSALQGKKIQKIKGHSNGDIKKLLKDNNNNINANSNINFNQAYVTTANNVKNGKNINIYQTVHNITKKFNPMLKK
jgi:hypothetical protein